jgi:hypothetical protein
VAAAEVGPSSVPAVRTPRSKAHAKLPSTTGREHGKGTLNPLHPFQIRDSSHFKDRVTSRGLSGGSRVVVTQREPCALFLGTRVDLLWTAWGLGLAPTHIHLRHASLGSLVRVLAPDAIIVNSCTPEWRAGLPAVVLVQGFAHTFKFLFDRAELILWTNVRKRQLLRPPPGWGAVHTDTTHAAVRGVTDGHEHCIGWVRSVTAAPSVVRMAVPSALPRDVHSVVSDTASGKPSRAPRSHRLSKPEVKEYKPGLYHAGGLFPLDARRPWFKVRSVFPPSKWCDRALTLVEKASVFDVPSEVVNALSHSDLERVLVQGSLMTLDHLISEISLIRVYLTN